MPFEQSPDTKVGPPGDAKDVHKDAISLPRIREDRAAARGRRKVPMQPRGRETAHAFKREDRRGIIPRAEIGQPIGDRPRTSNRIRGDAG
ncbi:hypothetical protein LH128_28208 [Sphingomonas sp. LH128]|nr:hypothetical protein LH128_28208 [Sphingomonas sp. LH128]